MILMPLPRPPQIQMIHVLLQLLVSLEEPLVWLLTASEELHHWCVAAQMTANRLAILDEDVLFLCISISCMASCCLPALLQRLIAFIHIAKYTVQLLLLQRAMAGSFLHSKSFDFVLSLFRKLSRTCKRLIIHEYISSL
jgi:hypothetical protein